MAKLCLAAKEAGWPILIHCQGDAAIDDALDAIEGLWPGHGWSTRRWRVKTNSTE